MNDLRTIEELKKDIDEQTNAVSGPDKYVLRGQKVLIESNARVEKAVQDFSKSTGKTEIIMIIVAITSALLALIQTIVFFIKK